MNSALEINYNIIMRKYDIILDTNILFSGLYSRRGASYKVLSYIGLDKFNLHISVPLALEYEEILKSKTKELGLNISDIDDFLDFICASAQTSSLYFSWRPCLNDPDDEMLLELAVSSNADFIVTHNIRHFKHIHGFQVRGITPGDFLKLIGE